MKIDYQKELNGEQLKAVLEGDGRCLVISGPGSGKTRTLVYRVAYLLEKGVDPENILLVTFTKKAASQMLSRVEALLGFRPQGLLGGTFHHIANLFLRRYATFAGYKNDFGILDEDDSKNLIAGIMEEMQITKSAYPNFPKAVMVQEVLSLAQNTRKPMKEVADSQFSYLELADGEIDKLSQILGRYNEKKKEQNLMDYDDLLINWQNILKDNGEVRQKISERFQYVLVDEYQDTNVIQEGMVELMAETHKNIMAVGDDAQSIYSFRGADIEHILNFSKKYPDAKVYKIETNYRSIPEILDVANESIRHNYGQIRKTLRAVKNIGRKPKVFLLESATKEAEFVSSTVARMRSQGEDLNKIAVLFRGRHSASELELALAKHSIAYLMRGGMKFFEQQHIKDTLAFLRALTNNKDQTAWERVLRLFDGVGPAAAGKIFLRIYSLNSREGINDEALLKDLALMAPNRAKEGMITLGKIIKGASLAQKEKASDYISKIIFCWLDDFYAQYLKVSFPDAPERIEDVHELSKLSLDYGSIADMLSAMTLSEEFEGEVYENGQKGQAITLSTIHQAKGLEWNTVFIIGLKEGSFPHGKSVDDLNFLEEERRLFYVAITRCKENLYITYPMMDWKRKGDQASKPSRFLKEIQSAVEEVNMLSGDPWGESQGYKPHYRGEPSAFRQMRESAPKENPKHKQQFSSKNRLGDFGVFGSDWKKISQDQRYDKSEYNSEDGDEIIHY